MNYPKVINVKPVDNCCLYITFETGENKIFDVNPYIKGEWFGKLSDPDIFNTVRPSGNTVEWADGQDIAPHNLYELSKSVSDWDPDYTKLTPNEKLDLQNAEKSIEEGTVSHDAIMWD